MDGTQPPNGTGPGPAGAGSGSTSESWQPMADWARKNPLTVVGLVVAGIFGISAIASVGDAALSSGGGVPVKASVEDCFWGTTTGYSTKPAAEVEITNTSKEFRRVYVNLSFKSGGKQIADGIIATTLPAGETTVITEYGLNYGHGDFSSEPHCTVTEVSAHSSR